MQHLFENKTAKRNNNTRVIKQLIIPIQVQNSKSHEENLKSNEKLLMAYPKQLHQINGVDVVGDLFRNQIFYLILALLGSDVKCRVHVLGGCVHLGAMLQQKHHDVHITQSRSDVQRCLLLSGTSVHLGAIAQQDANDVGLEWNR